MNRKVLGGVVALLAVVVAVWFFWLRGGGDDAEGKQLDDKGRTADVALGKPQAKAEPNVPRGGAPRWSLDSDPEGPLQLEGQVQGPDGKGVGGAEVWLASVPPRSAKSDDDGTFSFDKLVGRTYVLTASAGDLIGGPVTYKLTGASDPVVVRLGEGAGVIVTVTGEDKKPVEGADVIVGDMSRKTARTDAKGEATLRPVRPGYVGVQATAGGYAPATAYATVGSAGSTGRVSITLKKGFAVSGRVIDEAGKPLAKVRVSATGGSWNEWLDDDSDDDDEKGGVATNAKGEFTIAALASGNHTIYAIDGEHATGSTKIDVSGAPVTGVEITMKEGGVVSGKVLDTEGKPVPYATVKLAGAGEQMWRVQARQATTDQGGTFELRGLAREKLTARAESETAASKLVDIDLTSQVKHQVELVLDVTGMISGVVVDDKGAPVAEVTVNAFPDILAGESMEGLALAGMSSATTDGAGGFAIRGIPDGTYRLWAARAARQNEWGERGVAAKTGDKNVRVVLSAGGTLVGKLVIAGGAAPKLAHVQLGYQAPTPAVDGAFTIKDVTPGPYSVTFRGAEFAELIKHDIEIKPGATTDLGTVTLHRGRKLSGKVIDGSGNAVANARIKVGVMLIDAADNDDGESDEQNAEMWGLKTATSDASGAFAITGLSQKATNVMADHPNGRSLAVAVPPGTDDPPPVTLSLKGFGSISGVVTQKGKPVGNVNVGVSSKGGGAQAVFAEADDQGRFKLAKVPEGPVVLQAMQQQMMSMKSTTVNAVVTAGRETSVKIDIPVGTITLVANVKALPNHKVDAAQVFLFAGAIAPANAKQLADGIFQGGIQGIKLWFGPGKPAPEFEELVAGEYSLCAVPITGDLMAIQQKAQQHMDLLKVYCRQVKITPAPTKQTVDHAVPSMEPLPD